MIGFVGEETAGADRVPYGCRRVPKNVRAAFKTACYREDRGPQNFEGTT